jgi:hypothetical protein
MRLWEKAKRFGIWNPADIDFTQDRADWQRLAADEQDVLVRLAALFQGGEEAVALDILPLADVMARERGGSRSSSTSPRSSGRRPSTSSCSGASLTKSPVAATTWRRTIRRAGARSSPRRCRR